MRSNALKISFFVFLVLSLTGCSTTTDNPIEAIDFDVEFNELNLQNKTADFIVMGYPNTQEFEQLSQIIIDSLNGQKVSIPIQVSVHSEFDEVDSEPFFGTATYENGQLTENKLEEKTEEEFINLASN